MIWWMCPVALAGITLESPPEVDRETIVAVIDDEGHPRAGETVRVIHRPGLYAEREVAVGITDGRGRVRWTPREGGVARIRAGQEPLDVRVGTADPPRSVPVLLGLLLAVGVFTLAYGLGLGTRRP